MKTLTKEEVYKNTFKKNIKEYINFGHSIIEEEKWSFFDNYIINNISYSSRWKFLVTNALTILKLLKENKTKEAYNNYSKIEETLTDIEKNYIIYAIIFFSNKADKFIEEINTSYQKIY